LLSFLGTYINLVKKNGTAAATGWITLVIVMFSTTVYSYALFIINSTVKISGVQLNN